MRGWKQGDMFLAGQERRVCFDFIECAVGNREICGQEREFVFILFLTSGFAVLIFLWLGTAKFKQVD